MSKLLIDIKNKLTDIKNLDQSRLDYLESEYSKIQDLEVITISISDFSGNKTKFHSLDVEALIFLIHLLIKQGKN